MNLRSLRADVVTLRRIENQYSVLLGELAEDVSRLRGDVSSLKTDAADLRLVQNRQTDLLSALAEDVSSLNSEVAELKAAALEILRRLQPPAG